MRVAQFASRAAKIVNKTEKVRGHEPNLPPEILGYLMASPILYLHQVVLTEGSTIEKYKREIELLRKKLAEMKVTATHSHPTDPSDCITIIYVSFCVY